MNIKCTLGFHDWEQCKCSKCGKIREEQHNWNKDCCCCSICGKTRKNAHNWNGCKCYQCGKTRDEQHNWNGCKCSECGKTRNEQHIWSNERCECTICKIANVDAWLIQAVNDRHAQEYKKAIHYYQEAISRFPESAAAYFNYALFLGRCSSAVSCDNNIIIALYEKAIELKPDYLSAIYYAILWYLSYKKDNVDRVAILADKAIELQRLNKPPLDIIQIEFLRLKQLAFTQIHNDNKVNQCITGMESLINLLKNNGNECENIKHLREKLIDNKEIGLHGLPVNKIWRELIEGYKNCDNNNNALEGELLIDEIDPFFDENQMERISKLYYKIGNNEAGSYYFNCASNQRFDLRFKL